MLAQTSLLKTLPNLRPRITADQLFSHVQTWKRSIDIVPVKYKEAVIEFQRKPRNIYLKSYWFEVLDPS